MSSLRDTLREEDWLSTMLLSMRNDINSGRILILVEGLSDISFFNSHRLDDRLIYDSPENGKLEVIKSVCELRRAGNDAVYGVCDADFDRLSNVHYEGVYYTDAHDLEMMLIEGGVVDKFIMHFSVRSLTSGAHGGVFCHEIKSRILVACYKIGLLKWYNYLNNCKMNFKGMKYADFITIVDGDFVVDSVGYIEHILGKSPRVDRNLTSELLHFEVKRLQMMESDYYAICNGHDFIYLLKMLFDTQISTRNNMRVDEVESYLRFSYNRDVFSTTRLHSSLYCLLSKH